MKRLRRCKGAPGEALLEGPHLLEAAIAAGLPLDPVLATEAYWESPEADRLRGLLPAPPEIVAPALLDALADTDSPRGIVARVELPVRDVGELPRRRDGAYLYLDRVQDPGNLGAIVRVAEAAGVTAVALSRGSARPEHPRVLRGSAGSLLRMPVAREVELDTLRRHLAELSPTTVALVPTGGLEPHIADTDLGGTILLALGSEGSGLGAEILATADVRLTIPMASPVESLNVAVAAAVVLYERLRQHRQGCAT